MVTKNNLAPHLSLTATTMEVKIKAILSVSLLLGTLIHSFRETPGKDEAQLRLVPEPKT